MALTRRQKWAAGGTIAGLGVLGLIVLATSRGNDDDDPDEPDDPPVPFPAIPVEPDPIVPFPAIPVEPDPIVPFPAIPRDPKRIVDDYFGPGNRTKILYQIQRGDYPALVARRALDGDTRSQERVNRGHPALDDYVRAMTAVLMNVNTYGVQWTADETMGRPKWETIEDEDGDRYTIHYAYLPKNFDNLDRMRRGLAPKRSFTAAAVGGVSGGRYGLIWLPDAYVTGNGKLFIVDDDLPPELRALMPDLYG